MRIARLLPLLAVLGLMTLLPLFGSFAGGLPLSELLKLPLTARAWDPLPPSAAATLAAALLAALTAGAVLWLGWPGTRPQSAHDAAAGSARGVGARGRMPRYAWLGVFVLLIAVMAVDGGAVSFACGAVTLALALFANADTRRRTGNSLIDQRPGYFFSLFGASLALGWAFYWLNLYLQLWHYPSAVETVPFVLGKSFDYAVLLPALLSLRQWLASFPALLGWTTRAQPMSGTPEPREGWILTGLAAVALLAAPLWPDWTYPLTLAAPLLLAIGFQLIAGRPTLLSGLAAGDWSRILLPGAAALLLALVAQGCNLLFGTGWRFELPLLGGPELLGLPLPAWAFVPLLGLLGIWVADQLTDPWKQRPQQPTYRPRFPVKVSVEDLLGTRRR